MEQLDQVSNAEEKQLQEKITFELTDKLFHLLKNVSIVSIITAFLPVWAFYHSVPKAMLLGWFIAIIIVHLVCIGFVIYYQYCHPSPEKIKPWKYTVRVAVLLSTATWGSMGLLLVPDTAVGQNFLLFLLLIISSSVAVGTAINYLLSSLSILSALIPFIIWQFYTGMFHDSHIHIQAGVILLLYVIFLHVVSYIIHRLMEKSVELSFRNMALAEKLQEANNVLEERVKARTKELHQANIALEYQATHDELTGLINKDELLTQEINSLITLAKENGSQFALIYLTINNLQEITDNYGIKPDTDAIKEMTYRLTSYLKKQYKIMISRRDTFVILMHPITPKKIEEELAKIELIVNDPFVLQHDNKTESITLKASMGVVIYPQNGDKAETLKMNADLTMSHAKQIAPDRTQYVICSNDTADLIRMESQLKREIPRALKKGEFFMVYQVIVDLQTGNPCGAEALVRWKHPQFGIIPPIKFIELTERTGEIIPLGKWILYEACLQTKKIKDKGYTHFKMAVNLSARQLESVTLVNDIKEALQMTSLAPEFLEIEMTETAKFGAEAVDVLKEIDALGINISLDDFGQGQSGLSSLNEFDFIKKIKLDRVFIKDLPQNERCKEIVINSISLARNLSKGKRQIKVLGEGVDKLEQLLFLKEHRVDMVQGYYFSKPIPALEFIQFLQDHPKFTI